MAVKGVTLLAVALLLLSACTNNETLSTDNGSDERVATDSDANGDDRIDRAELAFLELVSDPNVVVGSLGELELSAQQVLTSLEESPPTLMDDPSNPDAPTFVARLTSMLRLRLAATALNDLGFEVDLSGTDAEINSSVEAALESGFEEFAQARSIEADPGIIKSASPHCVVAIAVGSAEEALAASERVRGGESARDVADEVNVEGATESGGAFGCRRPDEWILRTGTVGQAIADLDEGELSEPIAIQSQLSTTGQLFVVAYIEEVRLDEANPAVVGPFAGPLLNAQMMTYEVFVAPELGDWRPDSLAVVLPG